MLQNLPSWLPDSLRSLLSEGGVVVAILLAMAVTALAVGLVKGWQLWRCGIFFSRATRRVGTRLDAALRDSAPLDDRDRRGDGESARFPAESIACDVVRLLRSGRMQGKTLETETRRRLERYQRRLQSHLSVVELIATLAPSLGLLGTVLGMIEAFRAMELAGQDIDPSILSGGIWKALLTTAVGLAVAIPTIFMSSWLSRRIDTHLSNTDDQFTRLLSHSSARRPASMSLAENEHDPETRRTAEKRRAAL